MNLVLEILSQSAQSPVGARRKVFGAGGGSIGRAPECDWVLPSPYISRHHATVCCINGVFYIESTGENGVAVNAPQSMLPQLERRALLSGDRLFIDEFEISVGVAGGALSVDDDEMAAPSNPFAARESSVKEAVGEGNLDPLLGLAGGASLSNTTPRHESAWNHSSSLADHFTPPSVMTIPQTQSAPAPIAEDWNQTEFGRHAIPPESPSREPRPTESTWQHSDAIVRERAQTAPIGFAPPDSAFAAPSAHAPQVPPAASPIAYAPQVSVTAAPPAFGTPSAFAASATRAPEVPGSGTPLAHMAQGTASTSALPAPFAQALPGSATSAFSQSAHTSSRARSDPGATDAIVRNMVQGLIEVLRARAEFRNQFRLPVTRVRTLENNPLKFAINADDAMDSLTNRRNAGFMPAAEAFEDAFDDIRFHQLAMLAGMRAGFECVMSRFDPQKLQERFDRQLKHGGFLAVASKLRYWDLYADWFEELAGDADGAFQRLFGEEFASAYEQQLETLKRSRGNPRHSSS